MAKRSPRALIALATMTLAACDQSGRALHDATTPDAAVDDAAPDGEDGTGDPGGDATAAHDGTAPGDGGDAASDALADTTVPDYPLPVAPPPAVRRLSARELANTYQAVVGMVPEALAQVPPDARDFTFDRVVNAQTVSPIHAEAYDAAASEAADWLVGERHLDDLAASCIDQIMPPATAPTTTTTSGIGLAAYPDWALTPGDGNPDRLMIRYAEECGVSTSFAAPVDGAYHVTLDVELDPAFDITLSVDGVLATSWHLTGKHDLTYDAALTAGTHLLAFDFVYDQSSNPYVWVQSLAVEGPIDEGALHAPAARATCLGDAIDALGARAFRRPLTGIERARLQALHADALAADGTWGDATRMVVRAILASPKFLYLIETGAALGGGRFALDAWQIAQRLSYAICESPPDATLVAAAAADALTTGDQIEAQAERLMAEPCAAETVARFYRQWLWLDRLTSTAKDPAVYPDFSAATAAAFAKEADRFLAELTFDEGADVAELFLADHSWIDVTTAAVYGLPAPAAASLDADADGLARTTLPLERGGLLTLPGVLTVTAKFAQTSPVIRGKYVLEQILCDDLPPPPDNVDTTPPALDPTATTRERWAAHSQSEQCAPCHARIDPIGFTFEEFDAMGRYRATENGLPIDDLGAAPVLGVHEDTLAGVGDLAALIATSDRATTCLARQWLRFALGRMEEEPDAASIGVVAAALKGPGGSLRDGFIALTGTRAFRERVERVDTEGGTP